MITLPQIQRTRDGGYVIFDPYLLQPEQFKGIAFVGADKTWVVRIKWGFDGVMWAEKLA